jgi:hypothetical protein
MLRLLFFVILAAGIGNTVLRPEMENPYTLYRLLAPIGLLVLFSVRPLMVLKCLAGFGIFALYNVALATAYSSDYSQLLPSLVHYLYLFVLLVLMIDLKARHADFDVSFLRFVQGLYLFLLANLLIEVFAGPYYPNLNPDESEDGSVRAFFWNQNDLAVVLCVIAWMAMALDRFRGPVRWAVVAITLLLLYRNDSKAALLSMLLFTLPVTLIFAICAARRIAPQVWFFVFGSVFALVALALVTLSDVDLDFANDTYTIADLLLRPVVNILSLEASGEELGSLNNRTDAAIFVIIEYMRTLGFGLGAGGSWLVLTRPQYLLGGAQSPHNALLQFIVDFGYPVLLAYAWLVVWAFRKLFVHKLREVDRLKVIAILSFPMLGLSQSGAIVTNYFFFAAVYFIWLLGRPVPFPLRRTALASPGKTQAPSPPADTVAVQGAPA